jgi:hypothetical protein
MIREKILYISSNNGSDTRINKEIKTLSSLYDIYFLGVGNNKNDTTFIYENCKKIFLIDEKRNSIKCILKQIKICRKLLKNENINNIHVINEQVLVFFYPWIKNKFLVLDLFDSVFLKYNKPNEKLRFLKKILYSKCNKIIVTDSQRKALLPEFIQEKVIIIENYPYLRENSIIKKENADLTILFNGSISKTRGVEFIKSLLELKTDLKVIILGWLSDQYAKDLVLQHNVDYRGVLPQSKASQIAEIESDYILCLYEPNNINNINASPNKIFDAIQTKTPVIINSEVKVSEFVKKTNIGVILESYYYVPDINFIKYLHSIKKNFQFNEEMKILYSWESIEIKLIQIYSKK